jgi:hypothetical protein
MIDGGDRPQSRQGHEQERRELENEIARRAGFGESGERGIRDRLVLIQRLQRVYYSF